MSLTAELFGPNSPKKAQKAVDDGTDVAVAPISFEPTKKAGFDIFAIAPEVRKATRRERRRLYNDEALLTKAGKATADVEGVVENEIFKTVLVDTAMDSKASGRRKNQKPRVHLRHSLQENEEENCRTVFVGNLVNCIKRRVVEKVFKDCGPIESVRIRAQALETVGARAKGGDDSGKKVVPKHVGRAIRVLRGDLKTGEQYSAVAYVLFKSASSVPEALKHNGVVVEGRHIVVTAMDMESREYKPELSVFIGNIDYGTNEESVRNFFVEKGLDDVRRVRLIRDRETGVCKGFGYVEFGSSSSVPKAVGLRGSIFSGREIRIVRTQKSKAVAATRVSRREKRRLEERAMPAAGQGKNRGDKRSRTEAGTGFASKDSTTVAEQPPWMGVVTNPRRKIPKDLRPLVEGKGSGRPSGPRAPVKRKVRNPEKGD
ncbi:putative RNA recognition motif (a k a RRM RBD or RNP domain) [Trypanosoma vivax]|uniref:Putative RNA-binding protein n=1 Tax=Trypanosoma vivax (strain Y486) TaxID=1055687 RepID=G0U3H8_TRYVY|nr:putative RNA-binding protein [Trypanosoma vivax]KAH8613591.1 putative RNA recognition motif (a k a RRM RBD or RNP domain) [Trypanosoma vivax]CCC50835.1 putative RNA-binding protein [Trypanosoma vivax Y486]